MTKKISNAGQPGSRVIEDAIEAARIRGAGKFTLRDVLARLSGISADETLENRILRTLDSDDSLFCAGEDLICGRAEFFTGKQFLLTPDEMEIHHNILIPGHRFAGFINPEIFPSEIELADESSGKPFEMRDFSARVDVLYSYYLLLGAEEYLDYLEADNPDNEGLADTQDSSAKAVITVFDMQQFYREHNFKPGDAVIVTVRDYINGKLSCRYLPAAARKPAEAWSEAMADSLEEVIARYEHYFDIPEQLAWAFFLGGDRLFKMPEAMQSNEEFIRETDRIEIKYQEDHTVLASCEDSMTDTETPEEPEEDDDECGCGDEHHHHHDDVPEEVRISRGETEDFSKMLRELGFFLTPVEVDSYILDSCSFRAPDYDEFFRRCFGGREIRFADDAQEAVFHNMVEDRWETYTANYDRENDREKAELRGHILELLDDKLEFLNSVEHPETLPAPEMRKLAEIAIYLDELLRLLNSPKHELGEDEAGEMEEKIASLAETQDALIAKLQA